MMIPNLYKQIKDAGFLITENMAKSLDDYASLLVSWNEKMNLTAITEPEEILTKHFLDSLYGTKFIGGNESLIDVGTGAGFPSVPLKILNPEIHLTLLDSLNKRLNFLNEVASTLELANVKTIHSRAEDGGAKKSPLREKYDVATSRAMAQLNILAEYCLPYIKVGGTFLAYKGPDVKDELKNAKNSIKVLGGEVSEIFEYKIFGTDITHSIVVIKKVKPTPPEYPRLQGKIQKNPL